ncbi:MAG TPA: hypothetical protein VK176_03525 [Phycisphaerales bacterium]|nr:hypothetical protein [Phycisphaerales bacterium]
MRMNSKSVCDDLGHTRGRAMMAICIAGLAATLVHAAPPPVKEWRSFYAGPAGFYNNANAVTTDSLGNVYVTGESATGTGAAFATVKYSPDGAELWNARYLGKSTGSDKAFSVLVGPDGDVIVSGTSDSPGSGFSDYVVVKYDGATGDQLWTARVNGTGNNADALLAAGIDAAGDVYATGQSWSGVDYDWLTIKVNGQTGEVEWRGTHDGVAGSPDGINDAAVDIAVDAAGNSYVTGWVQVGWDPGEEINIYAVGAVKYLADGTKAWSTVLGDEFDPGQGSKVIIDADGNPVVGANKLGYNTFKLDASTGATIWASEYQGPANAGAFIYDMEAAPGGGVVVAGSVCMGTVNCDESHAMWKIDADGGQQWVNTYTAPEVNRAGGSSRGLAIDGAGNAYSTGFYIYFSGPTVAVTRCVDATGTQNWIDIYSAAAPGAANHASGRAATIDPNGALITLGSDGLSSASFYSTIKYRACAADFDGTGFVDTDDYDAFVRAFEQGGDDADFDGTGFVDTDDFDAFVYAFEVGC